MSQLDSGMRAQTPAGEEGMMSQRTVMIYGKDGCPYTGAARDDYAKRGYEVQYFNAKKDAQRLKELLAYSNNVRKVPVIVEDGRVTIGFNGT